MPSKKKYEDIVSSIFKITNDYIVLTKKEEYINVKRKIKILHKNCNNIYEVTPDHFLNSNNRCPFCSEKRHLLKNTDIFKNEIFNIVGTEYSLLSEYIDSKTKVKMQHNNCGNIYNVLPGHFLNTGTRCPNCYESREERNIKILLLKSGITFAREFTFNDLWNKNKTSILEFDFALFDKNNTIKLLLEYDGKQHFIPTFPLSGTIKEKEAALKIQQENDERKNEYCQNNNIKLFRIPYTEKKNIENIIKNILEKFND